MNTENISSRWKVALSMTFWKLTENLCWDSACWLQPIPALNVEIMSIENMDAIKLSDAPKNNSRLQFGINCLDIQWALMDCKLKLTFGKENQW